MHPAGLLHLFQKPCRPILSPIAGEISVLTRHLEGAAEPDYLVRLLNEETPSFRTCYSKADEVD